MGTNTLSTVQLHPGRCYTKIRGNGFRLLTKPRYPLHQLVAIANPDARRPTSIRYQYFFSSSPILSRACALSRFFFSSLHFTSFHFFCLSLFFFLILYGVYISLYMHFGVKDWRRLSMEGKLDLRPSALASCCTTIFGVFPERSLSLGACRAWVDYTRQL